MMLNSQPLLWDDPNKYARPARIEISDNQISMHGYQEFMLSSDTLGVLEEDLNLKKKYEILAPYFTPRYLVHRTVLDLGASAGFFCYLALRNGADRAIALDMDPQYLDLIEKAKEKFNFQNLDVIHANITDWDQPADVTIVLALIHWIYSCTAVFGTIDAVIDKISRLTRYMSLIEWIDPDDSAIEFFHHTDWNKSHINGPYNRDEFEKALSHYFRRYQCIGEVSPTRKIYIAFKNQVEMDLSGPLPFLLPLKKVIYSRLLAVDNGIEYWSRIYDAGDSILKQATLDLAEREAFFLQRFDCDYFPHAFECKVANGYSVVRLEKIKGRPLDNSRDYILKTSSAFYKFILHCLRILTHLNAEAIIHRDIRLDNVIMRKGQPVLFDFGWAISAEYSYFTPDGLGNEGRPPDGSFCDVFSMGKVIQAINHGKYPLFDTVVDMMTEPDNSLRITDLEILEILFSAVASYEDSKK